MKKPLFSLCFSLLALFATAQSEHTFHVLAIKWTPTSLLNPNTATVLLGAELRFHEQFSIQGEYGFKYDKLSLFNWNYERKDWEYKRMKLGARYYIYNIKQLGRIRPYGMLEGYYIPQKFTLIGGRLENSDGTLTRFDTSNAKLDIWGICVKPGIQAYFAKNFFVEGYVGIGWKWRTISHDLTNPVVIEDFRVDFEIDTIEEKEGEFNTIFIDFGLKIGFSFGAVKY